MQAKGTEFVRKLKTEMSKFKTTKNNQKQHIRFQVSKENKVFLTEKQFASEQKKKNNDLRNIKSLEQEGKSSIKIKFF